MKRKVVLILTALLIIALAYFFSYPVLLSPTKQTEFANPKNMVEFFLSVSREIENTINQDTTEQGYSRGFRDATCGGGGCQIFSISFEIEGDPYSKPISWWLFFYSKQEVREALQRMNEEIREMIAETECIAPCEKEVSGDDWIEIIPINPDPRCSAGSPTPFSLTATGDNAIGICALAQTDAAEKLQKQIANIAKTCPENCAARTTINEVQIGECESNPRPFFPFWVSASASVDGSYQCIGRPENNKYLITYYVSICVICETPSETESQGQPKQPS